MNLDSLFIAKILEATPDSFKKVIRKIKPDLLTGVEKKAYSWIRRYYADSQGQLPSIPALKAKFPDLKLEKPKDAIHFYVDELFERAKYEAYTKVITKMQNDLFAKNLDAVDKQYRDLGLKLSELTFADVKTAKTGLIDRKKRYEEAKANKGIIGLQTGVSAFDKRVGGITSEYIALIAKRGVGKTFMTTKFLRKLWFQLEGNILFVSNEMPVDQIYGRIDSAMADLNYSKYRKGLLTKEEEKRFAKLDSLYANLHDLYVINGAGKSVSDIEMEVIALEPALVICDGLYLTDEGKKDQWDNTRTASRGYQQITKKYGIPVIITNQMTNEGEAKYARAIEEDADIVMQMYQSAAMKTDKLMGINFTKIREEDSDLKAFLRWDFENWDFREVDIDVPDRDVEKEYEKE